MHAPKQHLGLYTLIGLTILSLLAVFPKWLSDDAYIIFRYAVNLSQHSQLTFNVGEDPVDGYTGVLLPLAIAAALRLGINPSVAAHLIGIGSYLLSLAVFHRLLKRLWGMASLRIPWLLLYATAPFLYTHVYSGLETMLFTALLLCASLQMHKVLSSAVASFWPHALLASLLLLLSLCRPEGAAYALIAAALVTAISLLNKTWLPAIAYASVLAAPGLAYFLWRWEYYGYPLPNTFYAKLSDTLSNATIRSLMEFGRDYLLLPTFAAAATWLASPHEGKTLLAQWRGDPRKRAGFLTVGSLLLFVGIVVAQYLRSTLWMNFSYRFWAPFYPIALLSLAGVWLPGFEAARVWSRSRPRSHRIVLLGLCVVLVCQIGWQARLLFLSEIPFAAGRETMLAEMNRPAGRYLAKRVPGREWLVVFIDAGAIPFYSGLRTVDFGRLNDKYLAHTRFGPIKERVNYFFARNPGALVFTSYESSRVKYGREADDGREADAITSDPRFENYALVRKFGNRTVKNYYELVFLRRDLLWPGESTEAAAGKKMPSRGSAVPPHSQGRDGSKEPGHLARSSSLG
jgi:arabinofuranosyltransferase